MPDKKKWEGTAAFIIPYYNTGAKPHLQHYLEETVQSIIKQTDQNWIAIIVDDGSANEQSKEHLYSLKKMEPERIRLILSPQNMGTGAARNIGIKEACELNCPFILYLDADDLSSPSRLEKVRRKFIENDRANVVYSCVRLIDENGQAVPEEKTNPVIKEIIAGYKENPVQGENSWIPIATKKNYINFTSATAVRTDLACEFPFPPYKVSEDTHTWYRYAAAKGEFVFIPEELTSYRINLTGGTNSREREMEFNKKKAQTDTDGFNQAKQIALQNGSVKPEEIPIIDVKFHIRLAIHMMLESQHCLAIEQIELSKKTSSVLSSFVLNYELSSHYKELLKPIM